MDYLTFKEDQVDCGKMLRMTFNYRQGSEWCIAVGLVGDVVTNYHSVNDLRRQKFELLMNKTKKKSK